MARRAHGLMRNRRIRVKSRSGDMEKSAGAEGQAAIRFQKREEKSLEIKKKQHACFFFIYF